MVPHLLGNPIRRSSVPTTMPPTTGLPCSHPATRSETPLLLPPLDPQAGTGYPASGAEPHGGRGPLDGCQPRRGVAGGLLLGVVRPGTFQSGRFGTFRGAGEMATRYGRLRDARCPLLCGMGENSVGRAVGRWALAGPWLRSVGLVSTDGIDYGRLPTQAVEVVIDMGAGVPAIVDLPRFVPLPEPAPAQWWAGELWETPPAAVTRTARDELLLSEAGDIVGSPVISRTSDAWRVEWAVVDPVRHHLAGQSLDRVGGDARSGWRLTTPPRSAPPEPTPRRAGSRPSQRRPPC